MTTRTQVNTPTTVAFFAQAVISFIVATGAVAAAVVSIPADNWVRAFFALGLLYLVTSTFTLAKCIRDRQEAIAARDNPQAEHYPYPMPGPSPS
jgi:hypothetical protein